VASLNNIFKQKAGEDRLSDLYDATSNYKKDMLLKVWQYTETLMSILDLLGYGRRVYLWLQNKIHIEWLLSMLSANSEFNDVMSKEEIAVYHAI
jgi:hypothetical protein